MKRFYTIVMVLMLVCSVYAQHRYHPEHGVAETPAGGLEPHRQHRVGSRETAPLPCVGSPHIPVVLVQFSDLKFVSDTLNMKGTEHSDENVRSFYDKYCNGSGIPGENFTYANGSFGAVADYFIEQSDSLFAPYFEVIGPVTLSQSYAYYGKDVSNSKRDVNLSEFYSEALRLAMQQHLRWQDFDNDDDGKFDFVFFIFAGQGQNEYGEYTHCLSTGEPEMANLIWPHESSSDFAIDEYEFGGYGLANELYEKETDGVGTMCHELSHGLGLPDLYSSGFVTFGMDYWDVMDTGAYCDLGLCPCAYSTYERDFMGWRRLVELPSLTEPQTITLHPIEKGGVGYKLVNPANKDEYYILENRQTIGFDSCLGWATASRAEELGYNHGMLVMHVDYLAEAWNKRKINAQPSHQRMTVLPADGELVSWYYGFTDSYYKSMAGDLYPGSQNVTEIPSKRFTLFTGGTLPINITNIRENEDLTITLEINGGAPTKVEDVIEGDGVGERASTLYDMSGRRVTAPSRGLYIKNGRVILWQSN